MKKLLFFVFAVTLLVGCQKDDILPIIDEVPNSLEIKNNIGIKLESSFVTTEVKMNVKTESSGSYTVKILDISNRVVSKEVMEVKQGDNILTVHTTALPSSAYRIGLYDKNNILLAITDFNKL